jgi:hypothetical protein
VERWPRDGAGEREPDVRGGVREIRCSFDVLMCGCGLGCVGVSVGVWVIDT